ncbi:hypothetical protein HDU96_007234 [Phlyctochytrium bullatum]|nr:hypothetical protein HDU96_007234 [Phlyctochytrium bullatum]
MCIGTAACPNGKFICENVGHETLEIPSSRVNDGICDDECCDGTDEYDGKVSCPNFCEEAGRLEAERRQKHRNVARAGARIRREYVEAHREEIASRSQRLEEARQELADLEEESATFKAAKEETESRETALREAQANNSRVAEDVAREFNRYRNLTRQLVAASKDLLVALREGKDGLAELEDKTWGALEKVEGFVSGGWKVVSSRQIEAAETTRFAREQYSKYEADIEAKKKTISDLESSMGQDLGPDGALEMLKGCWSYDTPEYIYDVCFFDRAVQKSKNGGDVSLGNWQGWTGKDLTAFSGKDLRYTEAKFEGGLGCWNGPERSMLVRLECGEETKVLEVSEPNKCEYEARVVTPALCEVDLGEEEEAAGGEEVVEESVEGEESGETREGIVHDEL